MKRYGWAMAAIVFALVVAFAVVEAAGVGVLSDPRAAMSDGGTFAAAVGVGLPDDLEPQVADDLADEWEDLTDRLPSTDEGMARFSPHPDAVGAPE